MGSINLSSRSAIITLLIVQFIPLVLMPPSSFQLSSQEWWLPVLLLMLALVATFQLIVRKTESVWPWDLISFSHGFNIISRLMLLMPHSMTIINNQDAFNTLYVVFSVFSMLASGFYLMWLALPQTRSGIFQD